jgi:hypothetical protein
MTTSTHAAPPRPSEAHRSPTQLSVISQAVSDGAMPTRVFRDDDGSYLLLGDDVPDDPSGYDPSRLVVICTHCLLNEHPQVGRAMDAAKRTGEWWADES